MEDNASEPASRARAGPAVDPTDARQLRRLLLHPSRPSTPAMTHVLTYFPFPGRGFVARVCFGTAKVPYENKIVTFPEFKGARVQGCAST